jgi:hypothetical protein
MKGKERIGKKSRRKDVRVVRGFFGRIDNNAEGGTVDAMGM